MVNRARIVSISVEVNKLLRMSRYSSLDKLRMLVGTKNSWLPDKSSFLSCCNLSIVAGIDVRLADCKESVCKLTCELIASIFFTGLLFMDKYSRVFGVFNLGRSVNKFLFKTRVFTPVNPSTLDKRLSERSTSDNAGIPLRFGK